MQGAACSGDCGWGGSEDMCGDQLGAVAIIQARPDGGLVWGDSDELERGI